MGSEFDRHDTFGNERASRRNKNFCGGDKMIWPIIGLGIYLGIGVFILVIFVKNSITLKDIGMLRTLAVLFLWLPIMILGWVQG